MKPSTEALINDAMSINASIQEDNLTMLEIKNALCKKARSVKTYKTIANTIKKNGLDNMTMWLLDHACNFSNTLNIQHDYNKPVTELMVKDILGKIDRYVDTTKKTIAMSLTNMVEASMIDLDKTEKFPKAKTTPKVKFVAYDRMAVENLSITLHNLLQEIGFMCTKNISYRELRDTIKNDIDVNLHMLHTTISYEGYVSMDLPQPRLAYSSDMEWTKSGADKSSKYLNNITYEQMMNRLADLKLGIGERINKSKNLVNDICCVHLIAQLIMSAKNTMMTMRNIHKATLNEAGNEGFFGNLVENAKVMAGGYNKFGAQCKEFANTIAKMSKEQIDRVLNTVCDRKMSTCADLTKACTLFLPVAKAIGTTIHGVSVMGGVGSAERNQLSQISTKYNRNVQEVSNLVEHNLDEHKGMTIKALGYDKAKLVNIYKLGAQILTSVPDAIHSGIVEDEMELDVTYCLDYVFQYTKSDLSGIMNRINK